MNRSELRTATRKLAERAKQAQGEPSPADIAEAHDLFETRKAALSDQISSNVQVKYREEPDWSTWPAIEEFFSVYNAALVELDNRLSIPLAQQRLRAI